MILVLGSGPVHIASRLLALTLLKAQFSLFSPGPRRISLSLRVKDDFEFPRFRSVSFFFFSCFRFFFLSFFFRQSAHWIIAGVRHCDLVQSFVVILTDDVFSTWISCCSFSYAQNVRESKEPTFPLYLFSSLPVTFPFPQRLKRMQFFAAKPWTPRLKLTMALVMQAARVVTDN